MKKTLFLLTVLLLGFTTLPGFVTLPLAQELHIIPDGLLEGGDAAEVTGDYVRVRSGPSLEHRILTKVSSGTTVSVLKRDENLVEINGMENYWYQVKLGDTGIEGWMFGWYLRRKKESEQKVSPLPLFPDKLSAPAKIDSTPPLQTTPSTARKIQTGETRQLKLKELGSIKEPPSLLASGDLNRNGVPEILFFNREKQGRFWSLAGYESGHSGTSPVEYRPVYRAKLRNSDIQTVSAFSASSLKNPLIATSGSRFSYIYSYDAEKGILRLASKIDSHLIAVGKLDGTNNFLIFLKKNRTPDNDGTQTYYIHASPFDSSRGRIILKEKIKYERPLPVKKIILFDLDGNGRDEVICEIGGREFGGGVVVLRYENETLKKMLNSGITTYKDSQFSGMWGTASDKSRRLIIYTVDPEKANDPSTTMGFVEASLQNDNLLMEKYYPLNKLLDDVNNTRSALLYGSGEEGLPLLILDHDEDAGKYTLSKPVFQ